MARKHRAAHVAKVTNTITRLWPSDNCQMVRGRFGAESSAHRSRERRRPCGTWGRVSALILLANSRQRSMDRNLGKMEPASKGKRRLQRAQTNSPTVSGAGEEGRVELLRVVLPPRPASISPPRTLAGRRAVVKGGRGWQSSLSRRRG